MIGPARRPHGSPVVRWIVLIVLVVALGVTSWIAWQRVGSYRSAEQICALVRDGDLLRALERADGFRGGPVQEEMVAQCLCMGELALGRSEPCRERLEEILAAPKHEGWLPFPLLTAFVVDERQDDGDLEEAAALATEATRKYPSSEPLLLQELELRARLEGEAGVLEEFEERLPGVPEEVATALRQALAARHVKRSEWEAALRILGTEPPDQERAEWLEARAIALAGAGRHDELRSFLGVGPGGTTGPPEARAMYASLLSVFPLSGGVSATDLLLDVLEDETEIEDEEVLRTVYARAVRMAASKRPELLAGLQERAVRRFGDEWAIPTEEIERLAAAESAQQGPSERGTLRFTGDGLRRSDRIALAPPPREPPDRAYEVHPLRKGALEVEREPGFHPARWILRDELGRVCGSGSVWPVRGEELEVDIRRRPCAPVAPRYEPASRSGGEDRRVFVVILDSADWRLAEYLRARGELPFLDFMRDKGVYGVIHSDPPYTAAALGAITQPSRHGISSFWSLLHKMGAEIGSNNFVGQNPVAPLRWMLPDERDLFEVLGAGPHRVANLLRSFGALRVGRHAEVTGPHGRRSRIEDLPGSRLLTEDESRRLRLDAAPRPDDLHLLEEVAGDLDALSVLAGHHDLDLVLFRIAAFDVLHHAAMFELTQTAQDDGRSLLLSAYRYADQRLAELHRALDADDLLIVMSDHGAEGALKHSTSAMFLASGTIVTPGRLEGRPGLEGLPLLLAELLAVEVEWPSTGLERHFD